MGGDCNADLHSKSRSEDELYYEEGVRTTADPSLNVVLLEDSAAVIGVAIALSAVSLSCLLGTVASFIIRTNAAHLVGRSLPKRITDDIVCRLENDPMIR
uniref:Uncharacterized protein n=1 Tax=Parascaris equorum TaxID=6256 RepID=A0A914RR78_PAREQ